MEIVITKLLDALEMLCAVWWRLILAWLPYALVAVLVLVYGNNVACFVVGVCCVLWHRLLVWFSRKFPRYSVFVREEVKPVDQRLSWAVGVQERWNLNRNVVPVPLVLTVPPAPGEDTGRDVWPVIVGCALGADPDKVVFRFRLPLGITRVFFESQRAVVEQALNEPILSIDPVPGDMSLVDVTVGGQGAASWSR